jgi:2-oxoglutarate ferredoxin oxidoreductase subunit gamma
MDDQTNIMFCGFGGQGIVLAGVILGQAAVLEGLNVAQAASYGSEARGSACRSEVIISKNPIVYPHISYADVLGAMSQQGYDKFKSKLKGKDSFLAYDLSLVEIENSDQFKMQGFPVTETAIKVFDKKIVANIIFLSAIVGRLRIVSEDNLEKSVRQNIPAKFLDLNLQAMEKGLKMGMTHIN